MTKTFFFFLILVADNNFPLSNIAFQLFIDVVRWFGNENTSAMKYALDVKLFWLTGLQLFKGKFLRFMSGMKNANDILRGQCSRIVFL